MLNVALKLEKKRDIFARILIEHFLCFTWKTRFYFEDEISFYSFQ